MGGHPAGSAGATSGGEVVRRASPGDGLVEMGVDVDSARDDEQPGGIDHIRVWGTLQVAADRDDFTVHAEDVGARLTGAVDEHAVADEKRPRGTRGGACAASWPRGGRLTGQCASVQTDGRV